MFALRCNDAFNAYEKPGGTCVLSVELVDLDVTQQHLQNQNDWHRLSGTGASAWIKLFCVDCEVDMMDDRNEVHCR